MYLHLNQLKKRILPRTIADQTIYDDRLAGVAEGVASSFDDYTGRELVRVEGHVEEHPADTTTIGVTLYPVQTLTSVEYRGDESEEFETLDYERLSKSAGLIYLGVRPGSERDTVRVTLTGGYWVDVSDTLNGTLPTGAEAMPKSLVDAWVLQTDHECRLRKVFGASTGDDLTTPFGDGIDLLPRVMKTLDRFRRY